MFGSPAMFYLMALAAGPIILHLLNRRRFIVVDWAPMKYLKLTLKTNHRRLKLEQIILLMVRTLLIALFVFALVKPTVSDTGLGAWLAGGNRTARVIIVDDSLSMGYTDGTRSAFASAQDIAAKLIRKTKAHDSLTVMLTSSPTKPIISAANVTDPEAPIKVLSAASVSGTTVDWTAALDTAGKIFQDSPYSVRQATLLTDFRRQGWSEGAAAVAAKWAEQHIELTIIDVGSRRTDNVALIALEQEDPVVLVGAPVHFRATVRNDRAEPLSPVAATLTVAGQPRTVMLPAIAAGQTAKIELLLTFETAGSQIVQFSLPDDALPQDNTRNLCVDVRSQINVLLVDGDPHDQPFESETDFLAAALSIGDGAWHITRITDPMSISDTGPRPDVMVLANVAAITPNLGAKLETMVRGGMGLMIYVGDQVDSAQYNANLFKAGAGLLPAQLDVTRDDPITGLMIESLDGSPIRILKELAPAALSRIAAKRILTTKLAPGDSEVRVLAHWNEADGWPAVIEKRFGSGRVLLWTITADRAWSDWPVDATYVLAMRESAAHIAGGGTISAPVIAGHPIALDLPAAKRAVEAKLKLPGATTASTIPVAAPKDKETVQSIRYPATTSPGVYNIAWTDPENVASARDFAVVPDVVESSLEPVSRDQVGKWLAAIKPIIVDMQQLEDAMGNKGREIWRTLAMIVAAMVICEAALAAYVGRQR